MADELERAVRAREQGGEALAGLVGGEVERLGSRGERAAASRAWIAWNEVNGDVERAHTTGVYVGAPRRGERDPELTVYVDSAAFLTDFSANREIYLARLETAGLRFSRVTFRRGRRGTGSSSRKGASHPAPATASAAAPPELTDAQRREIAARVAELPEALRDSVSRAMSASYRAQNSRHS
ncbi:hypothetical protein H6A07_04630 [Olsenella uli]|uniref:hypothetical protein n=1 Tax=Olsenella uli TaxID=133926 RepID=UPI0019566403|nr:hypothetical protein [Olsenella uli]MBM6676026.1 hypothetical protein [Olsenella uli]